MEERGLEGLGEEPEAKGDADAGQDEEDEVDEEEDGADGVEAGEAKGDYYRGSVRLVLPPRRHPTHHYIARWRCHQWPWS